MHSTAASDLSPEWIDCTERLEVEVGEEGVWSVDYFWLLEMWTDNISISSLAFAPPLPTFDIFFPMCAHRQRLPTPLFSPPQLTVVRSIALFAVFIREACASEGSVIGHWSLIIRPNASPRPTLYPSIFVFSVALANSFNVSFSPIPLCSSSRQQQLNRVPPMSVFTLLLFFRLCHAFNLDAERPIFRYGPVNSAFGLSLAQHFRHDKPFLLVGAPMADSRQPGTVQAGAVYACNLSNDLLTTNSGRRGTIEGAQQCQQLQIEYPTTEEALRPPHQLNSKTLHPEGKNHQLLGFVVHSAATQRNATEGRALACAPLLRWSPNAYTDGVCYLLNADLSHTEVVSPCNSLPKKDRHNDYGACEQGFSGYIDANVILTGLPGARKWTGGVFARYEFTDSDGFPDSVDRWTMEVNKEQRGIINILASHDYLGYSVRYGRFGFWHESEESSSFTVVSGATRYNQTGAVVFLPFRRQFQADEQRQLGLLDDHFVLSGRQLGSGFGSAIEVLDLNGDGFDDLIVGAPFEYFVSDDGTVFGGAVYVFHSSGMKQPREANANVFRAPIFLRGKSHSQFGAALSRLGNLDNDPRGYQDFAVGAPQTDLGQGAVFIFHGADRGQFSLNAVQAIYAKDINTKMEAKRRRGWRKLSTFGSALAGTVDLDGNGYAELAVGAHDSAAVVLFRASAVMDVQLGHSFPQKYVKIDGLHSCAPNAHTCFSVLSSIHVLPRNNSAQLLTDQFPSEDPFLCTLQIIPLAKGVLARAFFVVNGANSLSWPCGGKAAKQREERQHELFVPKGNQDWTNHLRFNFSVTVRSSRARPSPSGPLPVINRSQQEHLFSIAFDKNCGEDNECHSDLVLKATLIEMSKKEDGVYVAKVTERDSLIVRLSVENKAEPAYMAKLFVEYNNDELDEPRLAQRGSAKDTPKLDIERNEDGLAVVGLGNPMGTGQKLSFDLFFKLVRGKAERISASLNFRAYANSSSLEDAPADNEWRAEVQLIKEADLQLDGASRPPIVRFSKGNRLVSDEVDIGPQVIHAYTLTNRGPFYARNVTVKIEWPLRLNARHSSHEWILYTLEEPVVRHNGQFRRCGVNPLTGTVNPIGIYNDETLKLDYQLSVPKRRRPRATEDGGEGQIRTGSLFDNEKIRLKVVRESSGERVRIVDINCKDGTAVCFPLYCHFDYIGRNDSALIEIRARLWNYTFSADYRSFEYIAISSHGYIEVDPSQGILEDVTNNFAQVTTRAYPDRPQQEGQIELWILLVAVLIGFALLALLVLCCWRLGFFKRKKPDLHLHQAHYHHNRGNEE